MASPSDSVGIPDPDCWPPVTGSCTGVTDAVPVEGETDGAGVDDVGVTVGAVDGCRIPTSQRFRPGGAGPAVAMSAGIVTSAIGEYGERTPSATA